MKEKWEFAGFTGKRRQRQRPSAEGLCLHRYRYLREWGADIVRAVRLFLIFLVFETTASFAVHINTAASAVVNAVAPDSRIGAVMHRHAGKAAAGDIASLDIQAPRGNVDTVPFPAAHLAQFRRDVRTACTSANPSGVL
jgi:hypothetical protein